MIYFKIWYDNGIYAALLCETLLTAPSKKHILN
jgi:hypothetical protein